MRSNLERTFSERGKVFLYRVDTISESKLVIIIVHCRKNSVTHGVSLKLTTGSFATDRSKVVEGVSAAQ